jgi:hypothetical protein
MSRTIGRSPPVRAYSGQVLRLGTLVIASLLPVGLATGSAVAGGAPPTAGQCRQQWADLSQLHGENGNPRGPVPALTGRWAATDRRADRYRETASADDCGPVIDDFADAWGALESFQYDLYAFDPKADLRGAENDRRHYQGLHSPGEPPNRLSPKLEHAFRVIRHQTTGAIHDLEPALDGAEDVDPQDDTAVKDFLRHARSVKRDSEHIQRMRHPYRVIGDAELDEE